MLLCCWKYSKTIQTRGCLRFCSTRFILDNIWVSSHLFLCEFSISALKSWVGKLQNSDCNLNFQCVWIETQLIATFSDNGCQVVTIEMATAWSSTYTVTVTVCIYWIKRIWNGDSDKKKTKNKKNRNTALVNKKKVLRFKTRLKHFSKVDISCSGDHPAVCCQKRKFVICSFVSNKLTVLWSGCVNIAALASARPPGHAVESRLLYDWDSWRVWETAAM